MPARKKRPVQHDTAPVTPDRARRFYRLLSLIGRKPQSRDALTKSLRLGIRGFYRDLEALRVSGIEVQLKDGRYYLVGAAADSIARLPFPDPGLTLGEAIQLARGQSKPHRKLKRQVQQITR